MIPVLLMKGYYYPLVNNFNKVKNVFVLYELS